MKAIDLYVAFVCVVALAAMAVFDWSSLVLLPGAAWMGFFALVLMGLISESLALTIEVEGNSGGVSITFLPLLTTVLLFGPAAGVLFVVLAGGLGESLIRKKPPVRVAFNVAQWALATTVAGWLFTVLNGEPIAAAAGGSGALRITQNLGPFVAYSFVFLVFNHGAVSLAIAFSQDVEFLEVWKTLVGKSGGNIFYDLLISPIAIAVALFYVALGLVGLLLALLPLLFVRRSYMTNLRLQEANRDLLAALVKAIETRDPYTSGHSVRVSKLASRIALQLGLPSRKVEAIETAALLHDIGKIEEVYSQILHKPDTLTDEERSIIESHVTKGVELLESLSSFGKDVIGAVRHHHERVDGKGYPDGLVGDDIPVGARIIKVCDAIDAMLSDRPYRNALDLSAVRAQLDQYAGIQFDEMIVEKVISTDLLEEHSKEVETARTVPEDEGHSSSTSDDAEAPGARASLAARRGVRD